ncbi:hypothetical protein [Enterococcus rivorum]|uniref:DUF2187 domain-containing protein n=1 Tax=Enterococcus rivorum TaxID=762845 RepID=A0A1E5KTH4_9ENTE|nr:hypothetical protein [Enterococcus rivorum]MBP2097960.1 hypothetical protein [Enterococcus rivorum]OEH81187.1 hypothetical protein BCR26_04900 [Enterococcus rivorum]
MSNFGYYNRPTVPSSEGELFTVDTPVTFLIHGQQHTGVITKQLTNSAVVEIDENQTNARMLVENNGVIVINYKKLQKLYSSPSN